MARAALAGLEWDIEPAIFFDASLCVNELVTKAILAVEPGDTQTVELELSLADGKLCAAVKDHRAGTRRLERMIGGDGQADFGLYIISRLADRWGMDRAENRIWLEFGVGGDRPSRSLAFQPEHAEQTT